MDLFSKCTGSVQKMKNDLDVTWKRRLLYWDTKTLQVKNFLKISYKGNASIMKKLAFQLIVKCNKYEWLTIWKGNCFQIFKLTSFFHVF